MPQGSVANGFTLVETIVALVLLSVGGLALAGTAALIGKQLRVDAMRERAARVAVTRLESVRAGCRLAISGGETVSGIESRWSVSPSDLAGVAVIERVSYPTWSGERTDAYSALIPCP